MKIISLEANELLLPDKKKEPSPAKKLEQNREIEIQKRIPQIEKLIKQIRSTCDLKEIEEFYNTANLLIGKYGDKNRDDRMIALREKIGTKSLIVSEKKVIDTLLTVLNLIDKIVNSTNKEEIILLMDEVKRLTHSNEDPRIICIRKDLHHIITEEKKIFFKETISNDKSLPPKYNPKFVQDREDKIQVQMKKIETLILQIENSAVLNEIMDYQKEGMNILRRHTDPRMIVLRECLLAVIASKSDQDLN